MEVTISLEQDWMGRPEKINCKKNPFWSSTHKFYIKYGKQTYIYFGHWKLKPIDYAVFFNFQENRDSLTSGIYDSTVAQKNKNLLLHPLQLSKISLVKRQVKSYE